MQIPAHLQPLIFKKFTKDGKTYKVDIGATYIMLVNTDNTSDKLNTGATTNAKKIEFILNKIKDKGYVEAN